MGKTVNLAILPQYFEAIVTEKKKFVTGKDECDIQEGDFLILHECVDEKFTGRRVGCAVTYVQRNTKEYGLMDGYCIMGICNLFYREYKMVNENGKTD